MRIASTLGTSLSGHLMFQSSLVADAHVALVVDDKFSFLSVVDIHIVDDNGGVSQDRISITYLVKPMKCDSYEAYNDNDADCKGWGTKQSLLPMLPLDAIHGDFRLTPPPPLDYSHLKNVTYSKKTMNHTNLIVLANSQESTIPISSSGTPTTFAIQVQNTEWGSDRKKVCSQ